MQKKKPKLELERKVKHLARKWTVIPISYP